MVARGGATAPARRDGMASGLAAGSSRAGAARIAWRLGPAHVARRAVARGELRALLGPDARFVQQCPHCGGGHGPIRVELPGGRPAPLVSVAYAGPLVAVATAPATALALGVDIELDTPASRRAAREAIGRPPRGGGETAALIAWTRTEAVAKARLVGLHVDPSTWRVGEAPAADAHEKSPDGVPSRDRAAAAVRWARSGWRAPAWREAPPLFGLDAALPLPAPFAPAVLSLALGEAAAPVSPAATTARGATPGRGFASPRG